MKRLAAIALLALVSVAGCAAKSGGGRGPVIQRTVEAPSTHDVDHDRPLGQR